VIYYFKNFSNINKNKMKCLKKLSLFTIVLVLFVVLFDLVQAQNGRMETFSLRKNKYYNQIRDRENFSLNNKNDGSNYLKSHSNYYKNKIWASMRGANFFSISSKNRRKSLDSINNYTPDFKNTKRNYRKDKNFSTHHIPHGYHDFSRFERISKFSIPLAKYYAKLSAYGYCETDLMIQNKCCPDLFDRDWSFVEAIQASGEDYNAGIIISKKFNKIVISVNGQRGLHQLPEEYKKSNLVSFENSETIKAESRFNKIYELLKIRTFERLKELKFRYPNFQYIFVGHSLGGAVANLLAYGAVKNNILPRTLDSPVLITYGQPRTGNDVLANEVMLHTQIIFRVVRQGDPMVSTPSCPMDDTNKKCKTQLIDGKFQASKPNPTGNKFDNKSDLPSSDLPWHIGGLKLFNHDMSNFNECEVDLGEFAQGTPCFTTSSDDFVLHRLYFPGNLISEICRTQVSSMKKKKFIIKKYDTNLLKAEKAARIARYAMREAREAASVARQELQKVQKEKLNKKKNKGKKGKIFTKTFGRPESKVSDLKKFVLTTKKQGKGYKIFRQIKNGVQVQKLAGRKMNKSKPKNLNKKNKYNKFITPSKKNKKNQLQLNNLNNENTQTNSAQPILQPNTNVALNIVAQNNIVTPMNTPNTAMRAGEIKK
jgi:hypothetical protein